MSRIKRLLGVIAAAIALTAAPVFAADLPVKAPAPVLSPAFDGSGFYYGLFGRLGAGDASGTVPGGQVGLTTTYGEIGLLGGYNRAIGNNRSIFIEADIGWKNINGGSTSGLNIFGGPLSVDVLAAVTVPMDQVMAFMPGFLGNGSALPAFPVPAGVTAKNIHMYVGPDVHIYDASAALGLAQNKEWIVQWGGAIGMLTQYSNGMVVDSRVAMFAANNSVCAGPVNNLACVKPGDTVLGTIALRF